MATLYTDVGMAAERGTMATMIFTVTTCTDTKILHSNATCYPMTYSGIS